MLDLAFSSTDTRIRYMKETDGKRESKTINEEAIAEIVATLKAFKDAMGKIYKNPSKDFAVAVQRINLDVRDLVSKIQSELYYGDGLWHTNHKFMESYTASQRLIEENDRLAWELTAETFEVEFDRSIRPVVAFVRRLAAAIELSNERMRKAVIASIDEIAELPHERLRKSAVSVIDEINETKGS